MYTYEMTLAGVRLHIETMFAHPSLSDPLFLPTGSGVCPDEVILMTPEEVGALCLRDTYRRSPVEVEYAALCGRVCNALLKHRRCIFHGTAFVWRGRAWLWTAPSGTGKTTQYRLWKAVYGEELTILNGDKPVIEWRDDGSLWVHPSPWTGKEGFSSDLSAPLGGVIYLRQGRENRIRRVTARDIVAPLFAQILIDADTEDTIRRACRIEEAILRAVPVYELINVGDRQSAVLTHDVLLHDDNE